MEIFKQNSTLNSNNLSVHAYRKLTVHHGMVIFFFCAIGYLSLSWPAGGAYSDSDLWYHLSGGRYFFTHFKIPTDAYFSYISPPKEWTNYYWLFQIVVFLIHKTTGYFGLIVFRSLLYLSTLYCIYRYLTEKSDISDQTVESLTILFFLYALAIMPRELFLIRPHLFSYLFMASLILIIEHYRKLLWMIPIICLAWGNLHGMEYPIALMILLSYFAEFLIARVRRKQPDIDFTKKQRLILILSIYLLFLTPGGLSLLQLPFSLSPFINQAISEMTRISFKSFLRLDFRSLFPALRSLQFCILFFNASGFVLLMARKKIRLSHLFMFAGALILLYMNIRFIYETILLMMPLTRSTTIEIFQKRLPKRPLSARRCLAFATSMVLPIILIYQLGTIKPSYPVSHQRFPFGIVKFLKHLDTGGRILNEHNTGGFLHWKLHPAYQIFVDLQMSIFDVNDLYQSSLAKIDKAVFNQFIDTYDPTFITMSFSNRSFPDILKESDTDPFVPLFFDDSEILFANATHIPEIAEIYGLKHIDPFKATNMSYDTLDDADLSGILEELLRMHAIYEKCAVVNMMITNVMLNLKNHENIMQYPDIVIRHHPENYIGYALKGQVLFAQNRFEEATQFLGKAWRKPGGKRDHALMKNLHTAYFKIQNYKMAYKILSSGIRILGAETSHKDLYTLSVYAAASGMRKKSEMLLELAKIKTPLDDEEYLEKIQKADFWEER